MKSHASRNRWTLLLIVAVGALLYYSIAAKRNEVSSAPLHPGLPPEASETAPNFSLPLLDGGTASLSDFRGKVVILDFWASWCPPCKREIPDFIALQRRYQSKGLQIVGVALDETEPVRTYAAGQGINYPILVGNAAIARVYGGISGIPTTFVIDRNGKIVRRYEGYRPPAVFEKDAAAFL